LGHCRLGDLQMRRTLRHAAEFNRHHKHFQSVQIKFGGQPQGTGFQFININDANG
jgi:hypothetical protein